MLDLDSGEEKARVAVPSPSQGFLFPAPGFGRDVYYQSLTTIARVAVAWASPAAACERAAQRRRDPRPGPRAAGSGRAPASSSTGDAGAELAQRREHGGRRDRVQQRPRRG